MKRILIACLLLLPVEALAQTPRITAQRTWISEFVTARPEAAAPFAMLPSVIKQPTLDLSGGTAKTSAAFNSQTRYIRIVCEVQCAISATGAATTNSVLIPALRPEYFGVPGAKTISVIAAP